MTVGASSHKKMSESDNWFLRLYYNSNVRRENCKEAEAGRMMFNICDCLGYRSCSSLCVLATSYSSWHCMY